MPPRSLGDHIAATVTGLLVGELATCLPAVAGLLLLGELHRGWPALISLITAALAGGLLGTWIAERITFA